jgi:hypothetical protein
MRKTRADIAVLHRQFEPRFGAGRGPSSGAILRHFTHLHAAPMGPRFRAVAITSPDRGGAQLPRCVRREHQRSGKKTSQQSRASEAKGTRERLVAGEDVHSPSLRVKPRKTDSAKRLEILLPWSCNPVDEVQQGAGQGALPESVLERAKLDSRAGFGAVPVILQFRQVFANEGLGSNRAHRRHWRYPCISKAHECVSHDKLRREASEGEGARSPLFAIRCHLPLRGKLGWMIPRVGVKTTLTTKRTLRGPRSQAGASFFSGGYFRVAPTCLLFF